MSNFLAAEAPVLASQSDLTPSGVAEEGGDPFLSASTSSNHHRYSHFDNQLFALGPTASPEQAKRALEAHLAETERRIQDASKLGTTLVQQRKDLADRLKDVEKQQSEGDITPELRQKLVEIEKEYNEVGIESARAFVPKSRVSSNEMGGSPFVNDRSASPVKFESQATSSPSKISVPNRKQRNQPSNRVHDIEFATEISTSLLSQVRHLQALLAEKEEALKLVMQERSRLEVEAEGFNQRLRELDESEHRYKDENWNLETQIHEHLAQAKEAADREKKLTQNLNILQLEKSAAQKELDEIKLSHAKLSEDHASALKHHDVELGSVKRSITMAENERGALQRRVDDLVGQNQELAKAVAHQRGRLDEREQVRGLSDEDFETAPDNVTPEHSPPPSPIKGTPRHSMLESETLKSSLHHAHRMIQNLKGNIHREKTEKLELKRMLQDARDELESRRSELGSGHGKRTRKVDSKEFKKPLRPGQLGGVRNSKSEVFVDETNWEEDNGQNSPTRSATGFAVGSAAAGAGAGAALSHLSDSSDHFDTANETSDAGFETANENRGTETEDFQTGVEDISGSDELTETEGGPGGKLRKNNPSALSLRKAGNRSSFQSTASNSDEYTYEEVKTPTASQPQRLRLKVSRGGTRRSRMASEEPFQSSPASFTTSSNSGTPQATGQSLFAELGDLEGSDEDESIQGTPSGRSIISKSATPASRPSTARTAMPSPLISHPVPKLPMIDSGTMTEAWEPEPQTPQTAIPFIAGVAGAGLAGAAFAEASHLLGSKDNSTSPVNQERMPDAASQVLESGSRNISGDAFLAVNDSQDGARRVSSTYSDMSSQYEADIAEKLSEFPSPPNSSNQTPMESSGPISVSAPLTISTILSEHFEPEAVTDDLEKSTTPEPTFMPVPVPLGLSSIQSIDVEPKSLPAPVPAPFVFSSIGSVAVEPHATPVAVQEPFVISSIQSVNVEPYELPPSPARGGIFASTSESATKTRTEQEVPETPPKPSFIGSVFGRKKDKTPSSLVVAEDETRQSPNQSPTVETPESQRPFKEMSNNTNDRSPKKPRIETNDESSQTSLTAGEIDSMLKSKRQTSIIAEDGLRSPLRGVAVAAPSLKTRRSQESVGSVGRARAKMADPDYVHDSAPTRRPGSSSSTRNGSISSTHPPLPNDHKEVIAAAAQRTGSSSGGPGTMGPPLLPASAYKSNPSFRPRTPNSQTPISPVRGSNTPRALYSPGTADISSPTGTGNRSRATSVSSFASELDTRFNIRNGMQMPHGIEPTTDPRMINAITQTMIGEYLWKYTRKAGRGGMSENRHRRYFWVHPYTRTLYWSDRDPSQAGRAELKAKSVAIEAVRVVTDDNPMPPGLHRKSLIIMTPGRAVKFTAPTGQRHETWFNSLSYLLLRTGEDTVGDTVEVANGLTKEDVAEFNPGYGNAGGRPSLSSYNSRTTRNESPARKSARMSLNNPPQLTQTTSRPTAGTLSRLSSYWKPGEAGRMGSFSSKRTRHSVSGATSIYEASEVHDSAEDLREMIEKQDRESDRLENVRACCDGKHDVGHLHHHSTKSRHSSIPAQASGSRPAATARNQSRNSVRRPE